MPKHSASKHSKYDDWRWLDKRAGSNLFWSWKRRRFFCIDCGSHVKLTSLIFRRHKYTACPSCEGFTEFMCDPANFPVESEDDA